MTNVSLHLGDCLEIMKTMPENSVDSICTDPPYMLNFMGKTFDKAKDNPAASVDVWAEALRVAKPGAHLLAFGGDRTHHRMMVAIEDAGWEIRTCLYWAFGSGFPKSLAIDKAIDKKRDDDKPAREVGAWLRSKREGAGFTQKQIAAHWPSVTGGLTGCVANWELGFNVPKWDQWLDLKRLIGFSDEMDAEVWRLNGRKGKPGEAWYAREVVGQVTKGSSPLPGNHNGTWTDGQMDGTFDITAPATDAAQQWQGWGTALKPAVEIIVMARKPLIGTVAANVQAWGCGGLNIDACRVAHDEPEKHTIRTAQRNGHALNLNTGNSRSWQEGTMASASPQGRWPANLLLDPEASALLDEMSGTLHTHAGTYRREKPHGRAGHVYGAYEQAEAGTVVSKGDSGGASRFFARFAHDEDDAPLRFKYQSKASKRDRDEGLEGMEERDANKWNGGGIGERRRQAGIGAMRNHHPTVKPTALMQWLVRLVTPPGGTVLDPFMGSGSTLKAAVLEGFNGVGIELDAEYLEIARRRIEHAQGQAAQPPAHMPQLPLLEMTGD